MRTPHGIRAALILGLALTASESLLAAAPKAIDNGSDLFWPPVAQTQAASTPASTQSSSQFAPLVPVTSPAQRNLKLAETIKAANALAAKLLKLDYEAQSRFAKEHPGVLPKVELPAATAAAFDWCNLNKVSEAHKQLNQDCWANAAIEALECSYLIRNDQRLAFSPQPILDNLKLGATDIGGQSSAAFNFFMKTGAALESSYPYTGKPAEPRDVSLPYRAAAWGYVSQDDQRPSEAQLKTALLRHGPISLNLVCTPKFKAYKGGLFDEPNLPDPKDITDPKQKIGNHAVLLVGWDDTRGAHGAWKIKNTWGSRWGEQGFMWIAYGSNKIGGHAVWVRAQSRFYPLPAEFAQLVPDAKRLPAMQAEASAQEPTRNITPSAAAALSAMLSDEK